MVRRVTLVFGILGISGCLDYTDRGVSPEFEKYFSGADTGTAEEGAEGQEETDSNEGTRSESACETFWSDEVKPFLEAKCVSCHGNPPAVGPNALVSFDDMVALAPSGVPTYVRVHARVDSDTMPPGGGNSEDDKAMITQWLEVCEAEAQTEPDAEAGDENAGGEEGDTSIEGETDAAAEEGGEDPVEEGGEDPGEEGDECVPDAEGPDWVHDIQPIFAQKCMGCHAEVPVAGAPFSLVSHADLLELTPSGVPRYERSLIRMESDSMPPGGGNDPNDVDWVEDWIKNCVLEDRTALIAGEGGGETATDGGETATDGGETATDGGETVTDGGETVTDGGETVTDGGETATDGGETATDGGETATDGGETATDGGETVTDGGGAAPMTWLALKPLLEADCGGCHFGATAYATVFNYAFSSGGVGTSYSNECVGLTAAECMLQRIDNGTMPPGGGKVQAATIEALEAWIADGLLAE